MITQRAKTGYIKIGLVLRRVRPALLKTDPPDPVPFWIGCIAVVDAVYLILLLSHSWRFGVVDNWSNPQTVGKNGSWKER
jgi:hypothetical protein